MTESPSASEPLPLYLVLQVDAVCLAFEAELQQGSRPDPGPFLAQAPEAARAMLLRELVALELEYQPAQNHADILAGYLRQFPAQADQFRKLLDRRAETTIDPAPTVLQNELADTVPAERLDETPPAPVPEPSPYPQPFGDYELLSEIARGGMGIVFRAQQRNPSRIVALKVVRSERKITEAEKQRFRLEAEAAAGLEHPGIVPVYGWGEHDGQQFFTMACVEGRSLQNVLQTGGPLEPGRAAKYTEEIALAVEYAHQRGIVHRDLKPANVLIDGQGTVRVTDFGLAKRLAEPESLPAGATVDDEPAGTDPGETVLLRISDRGLTHTGTILGTAGYMPPEQARAARDVGREADIYAIGAVLYALLTDRPPFIGSGLLETLQQVLTTEPVPPHELNPQVDPELESICLKCLQKQPEKRYPSAAAVAGELALWRQGLLKAPQSRLQQWVNWVEAHPLVGILLVMVVLQWVWGTATALFTGGFLCGLWFGREGRGGEGSGRRRVVWAVTGMLAALWSGWCLTAPMLPVWVWLLTPAVLLSLAAGAAWGLLLSTLDLFLQSLSPLWRDEIRGYCRWAGWLLGFCLVAGPVLLIAASWSGIAAQTAEAELTGTGFNPYMQPQFLSWPLLLGWLARLSGTLGAWALAVLGGLVWGCLTRRVAMNLFPLSDQAGHRNRALRLNLAALAGLVIAQGLLFALALAGDRNLAGLPDDWSRLSALSAPAVMVDTANGSLGVLWPLVTLLHALWLSLGAGISWVRASE